AAAKCADAEEKFELEYKGCMMDLLIALLMRKNSMTTARFKEEQKKLVGISDFVKGLRTAGRAEEEKYILPEQKPLLAISDPERNRRWNERNAQWEKRKNACILNILREIKSTGKSPEEILKEKAKQDALLGFFGVELLNFVRRYREAEPGVAKETVLAEYLKRRNEFLNRNR
ncbi:MAG: hypothetical protein J6331_02220, partial [Lentisphaeria bacterium]|nr:hypothetical protein [Lentisphaeria bacterium]